MKWIVDKNHIVDEETPGLIIASMNLFRGNWKSNADLIVKSVNKQSESPTEPLSGGQDELWNDLDRILFNNQFSYEYNVQIAKENYTLIKKQ